MSVITEAEIRYGLRKRHLAGKTRESIEAFLEEARILPWTSKAAETYADLRVQNEARGISLATAEMMIAAHSVAENAILVTNDAAFARLVPHLRVENWLS